MKKIDPILLKFLNRITKIRFQIKQIYLFGSRARGKERPDSDYDLLILADNPDLKFRRILYEAVLDILLQSGKLISLKIFKTNDFERLTKIPTLFSQKIIKEGIKIG